MDEAEYDKVLAYYEEDYPRMKHLGKMFWGNEESDWRSLRELKGKGLTLGGAIDASTATRKKRRTRGRGSGEGR